MNDDATLVARAQSGDQAAFAELYERYFDRVYDFLARTVRDPAEAADLTQDAFLKAMNNLGSLTNGASFKSWLFTIARNTALNRLERASRTQPLEGRNDEGEEQSYDVIDNDRFGNPEEAAEASSLAAVVWEAAAALDPKYRSVLLLNLREGMESAEIADVMGVTKNHAYVLVNRMKAALESAVGAVALFRNGRQHCAELEAVINRLQVGELTPEGRRMIERHAGNCSVCSEQRRKLASPFAIIAGMTLIQPAPGVREGILSSLQQAFADAIANGAGAAPDYGSSDGLSANHAGTESSAGAVRHGPDVPVGNGRGGLDSARPRSGSGEPPLAGTAGEGGGRASRTLIAAISAGVVLLLVAGSLTAVALQGEKEGEVETAVMLGTPETIAIPTMAASAAGTAPASNTQTPTPTPRPSETPTADASTPVPAAGNDGPSVAPGGGGNGPSEAPGGGSDDEGPPKAPQDPGIGAPTDSPDSGDAPQGDGEGEQQPPPEPEDDPTVVTPEPCTVTMSVSPTELVFDGEARTRTITLTGDACGEPLPFTATSGASWIGVTPASSSISPGGSATLVVAVKTADRASDTGRVVIESAAGILTVLVTVKEPTPVPGGGPNQLRDPSCGVNCPSRTTPTPTPGLGFTN